MTIINLTPHAITLRADDGVDHVIPASGVVARVTSTPGGVLPDQGLPVPVKGADTFGDVIDLPTPVDGVFYLVSALVGSALRDQGAARPDVLCPGTGPQDGAVRNDKGHIVAVTCLKRAC